MTEDWRRCRSWTLLSDPKIGKMTALSKMKESSGTRGIITRFTRGFGMAEMQNNSPGKERRIGVDGHPRRWNIKSNFTKKVMENNGHGVDENLIRSKKNIEVAAGEGARYTKAERDKIFKITPDDVRTREEAAARCTKVIKRRVLKK